MSPLRIIFLAWLLVAISACAGPDIPRLSPDAQLESFSLGGLHVVRSGHGRQGRLLFLHGTPGNWEGFSWYLQDPALRERFELFSVDRPGFGASTLPLRLSLQGQVDALGPLCEAYGPFIAVGHSLGAPVALALAAQRPACVQAVVSIAGSVAAQYEQPRWFNRLANQRWLQWLIPDALIRANREVLMLPAELTQLAAQLNSVQVPVLIIQGGRDKLVDPRSAPWLAERLPNATVRLSMLPSHGHFVIWDTPEQIREDLVGLIEPGGECARQLAAAQSDVNC